MHALLLGVSVSYCSFIAHIVQQQTDDWLARSSHYELMVNLPARRYIQSLGRVRGGVLTNAPLVESEVCFSAR